MSNAALGIPPAPEIEGAEHLPMVISGGTLRSITWTSPTASAQIKSAILLAGVAGEVEVALREPQGAPIVTMDASGWGGAQRTGGVGLRRLHAQGDLRRGIVDVTRLEAQRGGIR